MASSTLSQQQRGCAHTIRPGLSFASSWQDISTGFCPEPAMVDSDYCETHSPLYDTPARREPVCVQCGKQTTRWFQPLIGTENFCGIRCAQAWTQTHYTDGSLRPTVEPTSEAPHDQAQPVVDGLNVQQQRALDQADRHGQPLVLDRHGYTIATPRNLRWLLAHSSECDHVTVSRQGESFRLVCRMSGLSPLAVYVTTFASGPLLWQWLSRPSFKGVALDWCGTPTRCGALTMPGGEPPQPRPRRAQRSPMSGGPLDQAAYSAWLTARCGCCGVIRADLAPGHVFVDRLDHQADCPYADEPAMPARHCCGGVRS